MAELLKNLYNKTLIKNVGDKIFEHYKHFDQKSFNKSVFDKDWKGRELKQRMRHITECLHHHLPADYKKTISILKPVSSCFSGFEYMIFQDYVECYGLHDCKTSLPALEHFTKYSSSEFAIRAFILQDEKSTMKQVMAWTESDNHHVRRLASEGSRPRLPWAVALPSFKENPKPVLAVLKKLMKDDSEYVRRSVANNLNDISKDNPEIVQDWAQRWLGKNEDTDRLIKHACRTLLKQGDQTTLRLFGYAAAKHIKINNFNVQKSVNSGEKLVFSFSLNSDELMRGKYRTGENRIGKCRIEFAIDFVKANGNTNRKVFKISEGDYGESAKHIEKYFSFKKISTRRYYAGKHRLTIIVNGVDLTGKPFELVM